MVQFSDASKECPDNKKHCFKVRLPTTMSLTDGKWEVGLLSLSMPIANAVQVELARLVGSASVRFDSHYHADDNASCGCLWLCMRLRSV